MSGYRSVRIAIEGLVQGVGYRAWTERGARALGLAGWVRNRRDGSVEAVFEGPSEAVGEMLARCREGPRFAEVLNVEIVSDESGAAPAGAGPSSFEIRPTA